VRWSAGAEDVWLELGVRSSARQGALIFPVPDPAATVELGPATLFDELDSYTAPRQVTATGPGRRATERAHRPERRPWKS